jgi:hypothetical protein
MIGVRCSIHTQPSSPDPEAKPTFVGGVRGSTPLPAARKKGVDTRAKRGHDGARGAEVRDQGAAR